MRGDTTDFSRVEFQLLPFFFSEEAEIEAPRLKSVVSVRENLEPLTRLKLNHHPAEAGGI